MLRRRARVFLLLLASTATFADGNADNGKTVYFEHGCYSCHGYNGTGRRPLADDASGLMVNEAVFINYLRLRADLNPKSPANSMPNYSVEVLSDSDATDVYTFIKTLTDNPPEVEDIPAFNEILSSAEGDTSDESESE